MNNHNQDLESIFGKRARHSEYSRGEKVRYRWVHGQQKVGEIIEIVAAGHNSVVGRPPLPMQYAVVPVGATEGFPDMIGEADIVEVVDEEADTAVLVHCVYCGRTHAAEAVEWCKNKYGK
jgi:hypothetical protein